MKSITSAKDSMIIHIDTPEQAQAAQLVLQSHLPEGYAILKSCRYSAWQWLYRPAADEERLWVNPSASAYRSCQAGALANPLPTTAVGRPGL